MWFFIITACLAQKANVNIYHGDWIDFNKNGRKDIYEDTTRTLEERVEDLLSQMTMEEKTCQMVTLYGYGRVLQDELPTSGWKNELWKDGIGNIDEMLNNTTFRPQTQTEYSYPYSKHAEAINTIQKWFIEETRLGIPVDFTIEGIRGLAHDRATCFPANIGMGSTWDKDLLYEMGKIMGSEAHVLGYTNIYAPILDLARDQRWGRTVETMGEDPFLVAELGVQVATGIQEQGVVSSPKHFAVYSIPTGGRDGDVRTDPQVTFREMHNINLYPFEQVFLRAGALGVMSSYNDYDGIPISGSHYFLTQLLRDKYKFKGYVVSDSDAIEYLYTKHKVAKDYKDAIKQCLDAGVNIRTTFTMPDVYVKPLRELINDEEISMDLIDKRVREILWVKFYLGLFDNPIFENTNRADEVVRSDKHIEMAKKASYESIVLLKNENNVLPLEIENYKKVLVVGPNAASTEHAMSRYGPNNVEIISVLDGIKRKLEGKTEVTYAEGCSIQPDNMLDLELYYTPPEGKEKELIDEAVKLAKETELAIFVLGNNTGTVGESKSRTSLNLPGYQEDLLKAIYHTGKPVILVLINGSPLTINWADKYIPAIVEGWFPGEFGGEAIADVLYGDYNPGGKLPVTFPKTVGQIPFTFPYKPSAHAGQGNGHSRVIEGLYPFGYGLSYTTFLYSDLEVNADNEDEIIVTCKVKNSGKYEGDEVVQLYFSDSVSSVTVYEKQLRGFERVHLQPGEERIVKFILLPEHLSLLNKNMERVVEPGLFEIYVGSSSKDIRLHQTFEIENSKKIYNETLEYNNTHGI
ncbi:MAG: glycoside hydrolase family 3 C-terminal domain-containing protein [Bacteroidales bacterium]|nr:glycoside hydrolase family 3 C-terminal domain-containing protein [Bacteroidales bacterium]